MRFYGAVIRVKDIERCRAFYIEALGLGRPAVDSNFWIEFELPPVGPVLALEQTAAAANQPSGGRTAWCLHVDDLGKFSKRLQQHGVVPQESHILPTGAEALVFADPEGNLLMAVGAQDKPES
jgi:catechol 2,3-dioxygenase-like lactoylglutathione lyase family enzyme